MTSPSLLVGAQVVVQPGDLQALFLALKARGFHLIGPTAREGAIVYDELDSVADLPSGWTDEQEAGRYRVTRRDDEALFGFNSTPSAWKRYLNPPSQRVWQAELENGAFRAFEIKDEPLPTERLALIGVRACDLHAIQIMDRVFLEGPYVDIGYRARRENAFIVAVNCGQAAATCFCTSLGTGPGVGEGFDVALTEILEEDRHLMLAEAGTEQGAIILSEVPHAEAGEADKIAALNTLARATGQIRRTLSTAGLQEQLARSYDHPMWDAVAARCMTCANCTMVCPTCFCSTVEDVTDLAGTVAERQRKWDSCFTLDFSYIHGGSIRTSESSRYRQWMTHKLSTWVDQFGTPGCVGCGRCIAWCPVGIDITEQARCLQETAAPA